MYQGAQGGNSPLSAVQKHCVAQILREPPLRVPYKHVPPVQTRTSLSCAIFASSSSCARRPGPTIDPATPRTAPGPTLDPHDAVSQPNLLITWESLYWYVGKPPTAYRGRSCRLAALRADPMRTNPLSQVAPVDGCSSHVRADRCVW